MTHYAHYPLPTLFFTKGTNQSTVNIATPENCVARVEKRFGRGLQNVQPNLKGAGANAAFTFQLLKNLMAAAYLNPGRSLFKSKLSSRTGFIKYFLDFLTLFGAFF